MFNKISQIVTDKQQQQHTKKKSRIFVSKLYALWGHVKLWNRTKQTFIFNLIHCFRLWVYQRASLQSNPFRIDFTILMSSLGHCYSKSGSILSNPLLSVCNQSMSYVLDDVFVWYTFQQNMINKQYMGSLATHKKPSGIVV